MRLIMVLARLAIMPGQQAGDHRKQQGQELAEYRPHCCWGKHARLHNKEHGEQNIDKCIQSSRYCDYQDDEEKGIFHISLIFALVGKRDCRAEKTIASSVAGYVFCPEPFGIMRSRNIPYTPVNSREDTGKETEIRQG